MQQAVIAHPPPHAASRSCFDVYVKDDTKGATVQPW